MESQDYDLLRYEESNKYPTDEDLVLEAQADFADALKKLICQANKDGIEDNDILDIIETSFYATNDVQIAIEVV